MDWPLVILLGSLPGVWIGCNPAFRPPENARRPLLAIVLLAARTHRIRVRAQRTPVRRLAPESA